MDCEANARNILERMLLDASIEPTDLPLSLLKAITNNFSDDLQIGSGGFAVVYKGLLHNGTVAVKKLSQTLDMNEEKFNHEVDCLLRVKHKNIVRFLGYCADTQGKMWNYEGKLVMADERERLLCFEFLPEGGLDKYISDASGGLEWRTRYQIITGICEGLHYLHQQNIVHLDLKPANILLDYQMVPKIADFGISRCFNEKQTRAITLKPCGSPGYMAPEFYSGLITIKSDIYSLGVIIMEILTGQKGYTEIENVLESWSARFEMPHRDKQLEHVRICAEIGIACLDFNPVKRPDTLRVMEMLGEVERAYGFTKIDSCASSSPHASSSASKLVDEAQPMDMSAAPSQLQRIISVSKGPGDTDTEIRSLGSPESCKLLDVHPLELHFPWEPNKPIECPVTLTNRTDHYVGVWITRSNIHFPALWEEVQYWSLFKTLEPHSTQIVAMNMKEEQQPTALETGKFEVVMIVFGSKEEHIKKLRLFIGAKLNLDSGLLKGVEDLGGKVHRAMLTAVIYDPDASRLPVIHKITPGMSGFERINSIDVHPTEPWDLAGPFCWERVMVMQILKPRPVVCAKLVTVEKWFIATGDRRGYVHVYSYTTKEMVKEFKAHPTTVYLCAVHPTDQLLLTLSFKDTFIKLWDWGHDWRCTRKFSVYFQVSNIMWNPRDSSTFAAVTGDDAVEVWDIRSSVCIAKFHDSVGAAYLYTDNHRPLMFTITYSHGWRDAGGYIWDLQTRKPIHKLILDDTDISRAACDPTLPLLAIRGSNNTLFLWNARTYRLEKMFRPTKHSIANMVFTSTKDLIRLLVTSEKEVEIMELHLPALKTDLSTDGVNYHGETVV
ncbi:hypothetical protein ACP70R_047888 [Stipagrostis hirtigluma subsp. patula]